MKSQKINDIIASVLLIVIGIVFVAVHGLSIVNIAMTVLGVMLIIQGVIDIFGKNYVSTVIKAVLGILIIVFGWAVTSIALYVMAVVLLVYGILQVVEAVKMLKTSNSAGAKALGFVQPCICLFIAISLLFNQAGTVDVVFIIAGVLLIVEGTVALINGLVKK